MIEQRKLYIGTNYHPHDWTKEEWVRDLDRMQEAGFTFIRLGHLCWDSFESEDNVFTLEWMDEVISLCAQRGIQVFLDLPTRPAPTWLHKKYPSIDICDINGIRQCANSRYMEDAGDPYFQAYAYRMAATLVTRYAKNPAVIGFGLCNELGSGHHSYSETARRRFCLWLKEKYGTIEALNEAWSAKRWSRKELCFEDIAFPVNGVAKGAPERYLDMKRFFSDEILSYQMGLSKIVRNIAPDKLLSCNHWAENPGVGYDYQKTYRTVADYPGQGFYPGTNPELEDGFLGACFCSDFRCGEMDKPIWDLEFQTGGFGDYSCPPGSMRMYAYLSYIYRAQVICAWTYRTMLGGEEQYVFGLVDHDGTCSFKWDEFKKIAQESVRLDQTGLFPRLPRPRIAIAHSYECNLAENYMGDYYSVPYTSQVMEIYKTLFHMNLDCNLIDLRRTDEHYDIVIIPAHAIMDETCKKTVDRLLSEHATVIMTAFSAKVDIHNRAFSTPLPGLLTEEFGIKIRGFDRSRTHVPQVNAGGLEKQTIDLQRKEVTIVMNEGTIPSPVNYHEFMELDTAEVIAAYENASSPLPCAISCNNYLGGKALYVGVPGTEALYRALLPDLLKEKGIEIPAALPAGIVMRPLDDSHTIYVNTTPDPVTITGKRAGKGLLSGNLYDSSFVLQGYDAEIICSKAD